LDDMIVYNDHSVKNIKNHISTDMERSKIFEY